MELEVFELGPLGNNAYWVSEDGKNGFLVDAPIGIADILKKKNRCVKALLLTHGHWDHLIDGAAIRSTGARIYAHADDRPLIEDPNKMASYFMPGMSIAPVTVDETVKDGQILSIAGVQIELRHAPGHSPGSTVYYLPKAKIAFVGDVIFEGGVGRSDFPGGDWATLVRSIKNAIYSLPDETVLYPGHGGSTTVGVEKTSNPFIKG